jgi:hypothetical protein
MTKRSPSATLITGDCLEVLQSYPDGMFDLVFGSPPYEDARSYGSGFKLKGQDWVDWMVPRVLESLRVCKGLVAFVIEGRTRDYRYSATPMLLAADLHRQGVHLRKPPIYHRNGVPGSGGEDWLRNDYEFILCASRFGGRLPWADNTACGAPPKYKRGGGFTNRKKNGDRVDGAKRAYPTDLKLANPGNVIHLSVGGGKMGHPLAAENEAPFHLNLAAFFVRSFCMDEGTVCDPFGGSHTTGQAAVINNRNYFGIDVRESQTQLGLRRLTEFANCRVISNEESHF